MHAENINVILLLYKREYFLRQQLENLSHQTVANQMTLHVISNNPDIDFKSIVDEFNDRLNIIFIQKNNDLMFLERHKYAYQQGFDYVILLDDDMLLTPESIERLYNMRKPNTYWSFYGRVFGNRSNHKLMYENNQSMNPNHTFNYGGAGYSMIDCNIYTHFWNTYNKLKQYQDEIKEVDDLFLSWVINGLNNWNILNSNEIPSNFLQDWENNVADEFASYLKSWILKNQLTYKLHRIKPWRKIKINDTCKKGGE